MGKESFSQINKFGVDGERVRSAELMSENCQTKRSQSKSQLMHSMAFKAFTKMHVYEKQTAPKEKDKSAIHCLECYNHNLYVGTKDGTVQLLTLPCGSDSGLKSREERTRKLGSSSPVTQMRVVPLFNHLLVLWDRSVSALHHLSLETSSALRKVQNVSLFEVCESAQGVEMATCSGRRRTIRIHAVGADRWEVVREVSVPLEPVALVADSGVLCVATGESYRLYDMGTGSSMELFPHSLSRQQVLMDSAGNGEFLLNGPGSLGMFVMKTGICQRPPLQWPADVLAARVSLPYVVTLQAAALSVYSVLDQRCKQTVSLSGGKGLISTSGGIFVFTERDIFSLKPEPLEEQIRALLGSDRVEEALQLLDEAQSHLPLESYQELRKAVVVLAGFMYFYQEEFAEAKNLFIKGEADPREIIGLYPDMDTCLGEDFRRPTRHVGRDRDLRALRRDDREAFRRYLDFLGDFLQTCRGQGQLSMHAEEVDCALLRLYVELGDGDKLQLLVASPNACTLQTCIPVLQQNNRFFALGSLYLSQGNPANAIQTWVQIADGRLDDPFCSDVYGHIVRAVSQTTDRDVLGTFADWILQRSEETGVQIFTRRPPGDHDLFVTSEVLSLLENYPLASLLYLEFLIYDLESEDELHHSLLVLAYVTQVLREEKGAESWNKTRRKLQQLLWDSTLYDVSSAYEKVAPTTLFVEKAILLGRAGEHVQALQVLVDQERDPAAAEAFVFRVARGQDAQFRKSLLLSLLSIHLRNPDMSSAALDLLKKHAQVLPAGDVVQLLPDTWSLQLVSEFLLESIRESLHQRRTGMLRKALVQAELLRHKVMWIQTSKTMIMMDKGQVCSVCKRDLKEPQFVRNLQGQLMHTACACHRRDQEQTD